MVLFEGSVMQIGAGGLGEDADLWESARRGDAEAFGALFDRHANTVYRYSFVRVQRAEAAEDVVSTVFSEAWRQRDRITLLDGSLRPWLLAVARNQSNRLIRSEVRGVEAWRDGPGSAGADHADAVASRADAPAELSAVLQVIDGLPDEARETLVLHVWGELSHDQIARELGISVGTVKSRLSRARTRLRHNRGTPNDPRGSTSCAGFLRPGRG